MIIEKKSIKDLKPAPYNPRQSTQKQEEDLKKSLTKFWLVEPIIYNKRTGYIVWGHFRIRELKKLWHEEVECVIVDLSEEDEKELNVRLNANTGSFDFDVLANEFEIEDLNDWGLDVPDWRFNDIDYSDKNKEIDVDDFGDKMILKLQFNESDYHAVKDKLLQLAPTPEQAVFKLLGLENE